MKTLGINLKELLIGFVVLVLIVAISFYVGSKKGEEKYVAYRDTALIRTEKQLEELAGVVTKQNDVIQSTTTAIEKFETATKKLESKVSQLSTRNAQLIANIKSDTLTTRDQYLTAIDGLEQEIQVKDSIIAKKDTIIKQKDIIIAAYVSKELQYIKTVDSLKITIENFPTPVKSKFFGIEVKKEYVFIAGLVTGIVVSSNRNRTSR